MVFIQILWEHGLPRDFVKICSIETAQPSLK